MENLNEIKQSLLPILKDLIEEYLLIKPEKNNVMTRQNLLKMITDLVQTIFNNEKEVTLKDVLNAISYSCNISGDKIGQSLKNIESEIDGND